MKNAQPCENCGNDQTPEFDPAAQLEALAKAKGIRVTAAIRHLGMNTAAFRRWRSRPPETAHSYTRSRAAIIELADQREAGQ